MLSEERLRGIAEWPPLHEEVLELVAAYRRLRPVVEAAERWCEAVKVYQKDEKRTVTEQIELSDECERAAVWLQKEVAALAGEGER